jgi:mercuric ion binding protein
MERMIPMRRTLAAACLTAALFIAVDALAAERTATLAIDNMYCELCPGIVKKSLAKVDGVSQVSVSFAEKTATVTYDDQKTALAALTTATTQAGYPSHATK